MAVKYLFNSSGEWIAFELNNFVYNTDGNWIGWLPWKDNDVITENGEYLGTIYDNRLFQFSNRPYRGYPGYPGYPGHPGYPGYPGYAGYYSLPSNARDVIIPKGQ
jgi:hypothetical protein